MVNFLLFMAMLLLTSSSFAENQTKTTSGNFRLSFIEDDFYHRQSPIVAIGVSLGNKGNNLNPKFIEELKVRFGSAYRGYDKSKKRHILVLSADDASPAALKLKVQQFYPQSQLSEISSDEFKKITLTN